MEIFLKAKHWQIFTITFGIPLILNLIGLALSPIVGYYPIIIERFNSIFNLISLMVYFGWVASVVIVFQKKIPKENKMDVGRFKIIFSALVIYMIIFFLIFHLPRINLWFKIPIQLFPMFCFLYIIYFVSRTLATFEFQRKVTFSDYSENFYLICVLPIGIWNIQPKINKLIKNNK